MTVQELLANLRKLPPDTLVVAEFADLGEGGNVTSPVIDVAVPDLDDHQSPVILITDHVI